LLACFVRITLSLHHSCSSGLALIRNTGDLVVSDSESHCLWKVIGAATPYMHFMDSDGDDVLTDVGV
jgi:hypothetical protein